jgi:hypothetical protein
MLCESSGGIYQGRLGCQFLYVATCAPLSKIKGMFHGPPLAPLSPTIATAYNLDMITYIPRSASHPTVSAANHQFNST